jgi:hypothetical protein
MIKQNKTKLQFILAGMLMLTFAACNNSGDKKEAATDSPAVETKTETPPPTVRDSVDTMEKTPGKVAPGTDNKPAPTP